MLLRRACACLLSHSVVSNSLRPRGLSQAPLSMWIVQARILEWIAIPPPGDLPNPGIKSRSPALPADFLCLSYQGNCTLMRWLCNFYLLIHVVNCIESLLFSRSVVSDSVTLWTTAHQASLSFIISWNLLRLMSIEAIIQSNHLILCCLLFLLSVFQHQSLFQ